MPLHIKITKKYKKTLEDNFKQGYSIKTSGSIAQSVRAGDS